MSEQNETAPWQLDGEMKRLWDWRDSSDCWNIADLEMDRQAVCDYLNELEQSLAHERRQREAAELENFKLVTSIGEIESARLDAERQREAAEAERDRRIVANRKNQAEWETLFEESIEVGRKYNALKTYTAKLLALAEEQRRALVYVRNWGNSGMKHYVQLVLKASDLDALLAEAKELGIDATAPAMAPETGNAPDSEIAYNNDK